MRSVFKYRSTRTSPDQMSLIVAGAERLV